MAYLLPRFAKPAGNTAHGDRPWVYFMIDSFFLVTQFFVVTFHIKANDAVLPQVLPPGHFHDGPQIICDTSNRVNIHVSREGNAVVYKCMQQPFSLAELEAALSQVKAAGRDCTVRLSYEPSVPYGDVLAVFNACNKLDIRKCGLIPLRGADAL